MDYVTVTGVTGTIVGFLTYIWTRSSTEDKWSEKWTLGIGPGDDGWQPHLERTLRGRYWEYININKENPPLIKSLAYLEVPSVPNPFTGSKEDRVYKMLQDMVNRGQGQITGIKKEQNR